MNITVFELGSKCSCVSLAKTCATHECFLLVSDSVDSDGVAQRFVQLCGGL